MTGAILMCGDYRLINGRFLPFKHIESTSMIKYLIEMLRRDGIGYIVVITGYRRTELQRHLHEEGVNCVEDEQYYLSTFYDRLRLGVGSLLSTLDEAVIIDVTGTEGSFILTKDSFETILFEADDYRLKTFLESEKRAFYYELPVSRSADASALLCVNGTNVDCELVSLLELTEDSGSLAQAASTMGISYSKAWKIIKDHPGLLEKKAGGKGGGGSTLSPYAQELVKGYKQLQKELDNRLDQLFEKYFQI